VASPYFTDITIGNKYGYPEESVYQDMPVEIRSQFRGIPTREIGACGAVEKVYHAGV
jgi:hypothetical protein